MSNILGKITILIFIIGCLFLICLTAICSYKTFKFLTVKFQQKEVQPFDLN